jgi:hypothetical protein
MSFRDSDINSWPDSWSGTKEDLPYGRKIVRLFKRFISSLNESALAPRTINRHINNLWLLGGWLIGQINYFPEERKSEPLLLITHYVDGFDGPLIRDLTESEQRSFDATCRKFYSWLVSNRLKRSSLY